MKKLFILLGIFIVLLFACTKKEQNNPEVKSKIEKPLIVAMELQFPPFETSDENGEPMGISVDIAKGLADFLGRKLIIKNTSWVGLIPSLNTGDADLVLSSMSITIERQQVVDFSVPYANSGLTLLLNKSSKANSFEDLNKPEITVVAKSGTTGALLANKQLVNAKKMYLDDVAPCVLEVVQGNADAFIYDALTVYENHKKHPDRTKVNLNPIVGTAGNWGIAVKKGNTELLEKVNEYIIKSQKTNAFNKIAEKHLGEMIKVFKENNIPFFFDTELK